MREPAHQSPQIVSPRFAIVKRADRQRRIGRGFAPAVRGEKERTRQPGANQIGKRAPAGTARPRPADRRRARRSTLWSPAAPTLRSRSRFGFEPLRAIQPSGLPDTNAASNRDVTDSSNATMRRPARLRLHRVDSRGERRVVWQERARLDRRQRQDHAIELAHDRCRARADPPRAGRGVQSARGARP